MAEDKVDGREVNWRQVLPWTEIFRGFGIALDLNKLLLAAGGIVATWVGWWLLSVVFGALYTAQPTWPSSYQQSASSTAEAFKTFKRERNRWNLMREAAGVGQSDEVYEVPDIAETAEEYDAVKAKVGEGPENYNLAALDDLQTPPGKVPTPERPLDASRVRVYKERLGKVKPYGRFSLSPWSEPRGENPYLLVTGQAGIPWEAGRAGDWFLTREFPVLIEPLVKLMRPVVYFLSPRADSIGTKLYFLLVFVWTVLVWSLFGGAITRIAVVQAARPGEPIGLTDAVRFTLKRFFSYFAAPLFPVVLVFVLLVFAFVFSLFHLLPGFGDIFVDGLLWFVMLLIGLVMALALVGLAVGWPLMAPTISAEGTDSWEALSRSFSYVFQRPWHYLWYAAVTVAYGAVVIFFVGFMGSLTVYLSKWAIAQTTLVSSREPSYLFAYAPQSFGWRTLLLQGARDDYKENEADNPTYEDLVVGGQINPPAYKHYAADLHWWNRVGAGLVSFWLGLLFLLILGFGYSFFFSTASIIYLLMRRNLDAAEMDEVYLEEDDHDGLGGSLAPAVAESSRAAPSLQMVEPPSLRPAAPPPVPAPAPASAAVSPTPPADATAITPPPPASAPAAAPKHASENGGPPAD
jgi:hypothetical protein